MFWHAAESGRIAYAFTDRTGGHSPGPWSSLNLSSTSRDHRLNVAANLDAVAQAAGVDRLVTMMQVHGRQVLWTDEVPDGEVLIADALLTDEVGVGVLVRFADCTPIVLAAPGEAMAGVVHAGRAGLVGGVVAAAVDALHARGATKVQAVIGPRACGRCYELPAEMADAVIDVVPEARSTTSWGTPSVDVGAGVIAQLVELDVEVTDIGAAECTIEDERWFSFRRQGQDSGRLGAVAVVRPPR